MSSTTSPPGLHRRAHRAAKSARALTLSAVLLLTAACEPTPQPQYPDDVVEYVTVRVLAVRRAADGLSLVDWQGFSVCDELTCEHTRPPTYCVPDAGPDVAPPADVGATDASAPGDAGRDARSGDAGGGQDAGSTDAGAAADAITPSDASAAVDASARVDEGTDAGAPVDAGTDAAAPADLGLARMPLGADADMGCLPGPPPDAGYVPADCYGYSSPECESADARSDREETCTCTGGYVLEAEGLRLHFAPGALETIESAGGVELVGGAAVATANGEPVPPVRATLDGAGLSGIIRIIDVHTEYVSPGTLDSYLTFSGAFELSTDRISLERGLFRPVEAE